MKHAGYKYKECGLDNVYLMSGYEYVNTSRGRHLVINDIDGLHRAIGRSLVEKKRTLTGKEMRFLRHEMLMSQETLAELLKVSVQSINRWENDKTETSKPAESLVRLLYMEHLGGNENIKKTLKKIADLEDRIDKTLTLMNKKDEWLVAA